MGRRFSVRVQLQLGVLGKVWSKSAAACSNILLLEQFQSHNSPFFVGFCRQLGRPGAAPQHIPPLSTGKKKSLIILSPKKPQTLALSMGGRITNPSWCAEASQSQPRWGCWSQYWFFTGSVLVLSWSQSWFWFCPGCQCPGAAGAPAPSSCPLLQHSQFPNPFFLPRVL